MLRLGASGRRARVGLWRGRRGMTLAPVRVAAVGCGYWGPNVIRNLDAVHGFELCCICDAEPDRLRPVAARYPSARSTTRVDDLLGDPAIEAVYLATPVSSHYSLVKRALESEKHVLIEKPLATTVAQAEELVELAGASGLPLMVGHALLLTH